MRRRMLITLVGLLACLGIGVTGTANAATLDFTGTMTIQVAMQAWEPFIIPGAGTAQVSDDGSTHLLSLSLAGGTFGPASTTIDGYDDLRFTSVFNLSGVFTGISGGSTFTLARMPVRDSKSSANHSRVADRPRSSMMLGLSSAHTRLTEAMVWSRRAVIDR